MCLFKKHWSLCPPDAPESAVYLQSACTQTSNCWYSKRPLGHITLAKTAFRICICAGIQGYKTKHSLRVTSTSRLHHSGVDNQLVMERTGHRSIHGIRSYKRISKSQREALSDILKRKTPHTDTQLKPSLPTSTIPTAVPILTLFKHLHIISYRVSTYLQLCSLTALFIITSTQTPIIIGHSSGHPVYFQLYNKYFHVHFQDKSDMKFISYM